MKMNSRLFLITLSLIMVISTSPVIGAEEHQENIENKESQEKEVLKLNIEDAVNTGIDNSIILRQVENEIFSSDVSKDRAKYLSRKMKDSDRSLSDARSVLSGKQNELDAKKNQIKNALISSGIPSDKVNEMLQTGEVPNDIQLPDQLKDAVSEVYKNEKLLNENWTRLDNKELSFTEALQAAGTSIGGKLNFDSLDQLNVKSTSNMMNTMASVSYEVTEASYEIYKNQVAMLIQKSYYDVLKAQKMLEAKNKAMERGRKQYEFAKASYEEGLKAKDDMLMAELYYKATQLEYRKAQGDLQNALTEFKKNINVPLDSDVVLTQVLEDKGEEPDLNEGLESGLKKRLEIRKGIGEVVVYDANFESVSKRYPSKTFQYREAELLKERARINYEKTILDVKNSIYQSYEVLKTTNDMLRMADDMADKAYENLEIAEFKYKEGFGVETSLLKKLDLEASAGTIIEVLAAEENLAQIEEKVIEITYSYNLAKVKYYNDIGKYIY